MNFTVYLAENGAPATGLSPLPVINIYTLNGSLVDSGNMIEVDDGFYYYPFITDNALDYVALADAGLAGLGGSEQYAPCISTVQGEVSDVLEDTDVTIPAQLDIIQADTDLIPAIKVDTDRLPAMEADTDLIPAIKVDTDRLPAIETDVTFIKAIEGGYSWEIILNQMIFTDESQVEIARFNLFDQFGNPAMENVFKRVLV